jgi:serine/threonine protein kinase
MEMHVAHRDLKLENILLSGDSIRLIDFGLSRVGNLMFSQCGSFPYAAPEIVRGERYSYAVDMWSLGICIYAMASGTLPFASSSQPELLRQITSVAPKPLTFLSESAQDFIGKLLEKNPSQRLTVDQAIAHRFVQESGDVAMLDVGGIDEYKLFSAAGEPDPAVVEELVGRGFCREGSERLSRDTDDEFSIAYRILKTVKIRNTMGAGLPTGVKLTRNLSNPQRPKLTFVGMKLSTPGPATLMSLRSDFSVKKSAASRPPIGTLRVRRLAANSASATVLTFPSPGAGLVSNAAKSDSSLQLVDILPVGP